MRFRGFPNIYILFFLIFLFQFFHLSATFKYINYRDGDTEIYKSNVGKIKVLYSISDSTIKQIIKVANLTLSGLYTYNDSDIFHNSTKIHFLNFNEVLTDKSHSIMFKFPLRDSMRWGGAGIAERGNKRVAYRYETYVKDTILTTSNGEKKQCFEIVSNNTLFDGEKSHTIYFFDPATKKFIKIEKSINIRGIAGKFLHLIHANTIILYK